MAGNTFEERISRLEEQLAKLQALTQGLAAWETGAVRLPVAERDTTPRAAATRDSAGDERERGADQEDASRREVREPRA
jgi:hypothetical protein